jgi:transglutaminase-like putative cysteine protease
VPVNRARKGAAAAENAGSYTAPPMAAAAFHPDLAEGKAGALIDLSAAAEGYVAVSATSDKRLKFQVRKDDWTYNYDLASDGTPSIFPLQCGNGHYTFRIMENVTEKKYVQIGGAERDVTLIDEFQPFLRPSDYVDYSPDSACVKKAAELASGCSTRLEVVGAVYNYVIRNVRYDTRKAKNVTSGYLPYPDETMSTGRGICFDYASLTAAMLRSQGVPTKVIFGYVSPDDLYHAWNMFYTEESGWVTVSFEVSKNSWTRLDLTFTANGANDKFVGDGSNYADVYSY